MPKKDDIRATRTRAFATTIAAEHVAGSQREPTTSPEGARAAQSASLPDVGSVVGMHYRLVRLLGEGNFGKVYVAERVDVPEHVVALKVLPRSHYAGRNVERELVMLATVGHPNVVQLKDHGTTSDYVWFTMPVYEGETLATRLERGTLGLREAYDIFLPIARGIEALHQAGLRHQDIKPDNIFLARFAGRLHPFLLDLGVAAERDASFVAGTALYAAPEQLASILGIDEHAPLSEKMDTYCFGAMLLVALVGERRFPGAKARTRTEVAESHRARAERPLADDALPELLGGPRDLLVERLQRWMAMHPDDRPSMSAVAEQLEVLLEHERELERIEDSLRQRQKRQLVQARLAGAALLVAAFALIGIGLWKRETLELASELEEARALEAESFDKLDLCSASHAIARREAATCALALSEEQDAHRSTLSALSKQGDACEVASEQLVELRSTLRAETKRFEEELEAEQLRAKTERDRQVADFGAEREKLLLAASACDQELDRVRAERDRCEIDKASCLSSHGPTEHSTQIAEPNTPAWTPSLGTSSPVAPPPSPPPLGPTLEPSSPPNPEQHTPSAPVELSPMAPSPTPAGGLGPVEPGSY